MKLNLHHRRITSALHLAAALILFIGSAAAQTAWDTFSDTWVATDALGRKVPTFAEVGAPRQDRTLGIFYFLWLGPHAHGGPFDITRILQKEPGAMTNKLSPLWGPMHVPHHWGESIFGYYNTDDPYVLRKHAQMLTDAGVDAVIFDVTNQLTYRTNYLALLREFAAIRALGGRAPQVAFLTPFWDPSKVVNELYTELYQPGIHPELWFRWEGKPLILADPARLTSTEGFKEHNLPVKIEPGHTIGQKFTTDQPFETVAGAFPTWGARNSAITLTLRQAGPEGALLLSNRFVNVADNSWPTLVATNQLLPPGTYYLEASDPSGAIGWWSHTGDVFKAGEAVADRVAVTGDRTLQIGHVTERAAEIRRFFTFRKPQPDYFEGPTGPNMWSWLEVHPQHVFTNAAGQKEQMSVGVAQNAVDGRLGSMSEPGAHGRSFHDGAVDKRPGATRLGLNLTEQFERALREDPRFLFVTGWNEWIAGRFEEFNRIKYPVMFVDQFDQEHSRDIEPMKGGHGDDYYYQFISYVRRYKGVRPALPPSAPKTIHVKSPDGFKDWNGVQPEYRDDRGDTFHRDFPGYNAHCQYTNTSGRNDFISAKVARDDRYVYFHVSTADPITPNTDPRWMWLLIDTDQNHATGWEGYDLIVNYDHDPAGSVTKAWVSENAGGWKWKRREQIPITVVNNELQLAIPRALIAPKGAPLRFDFKWADNATDSGNIIEWLDSGDCAPNARFNYRYDTTQQANNPR